VFTRLDLKGSLPADPVAILHDYSRVDVTLDAIGISIELLLSRNKLLKFDAMLVVVGAQHHVEPGRDIPDCSVAVGHDLFLGFLQKVEENELTLDGSLHHTLKFLLPEVHGLQDLLENVVDDIA
jgi:hypothetical protein